MKRPPRSLRRFHRHGAHLDDACGSRAIPDGRTGRRRIQEAPMSRWPTTAPGHDAQKPSPKAFKGGRRHHRRSVSHCRRRPRTRALPAAHQDESPRRCLSSCRRGKSATALMKGFGDSHGAQAGIKLLRARRHTTDERCCRTWGDVPLGVVTMFHYPPPRRPPPTRLRRGITRRPYGAQRCRTFISVATWDGLQRSSTGDPAKGQAQHDNGHGRS